MLRTKAARLVVFTLLALALLSVSVGCNANEPSGTVRYRLDFDSVWSETTHPTGFPSSPHFSGLIGVTHDESVNLWQAGQKASDGIKSMAETGSKIPLDTEIVVAIADGNADVEISGGGIGTSPGSVSLTFHISQDHSLVSVVSMIAPSPDWFVGTESLDLFANGVWQEKVVVDLYPYDAGTDSGMSYTSADSATALPKAIFRITGIPFTDGTTVPKLGTFTFTKL